MRKETDFILEEDEYYRVIFRIYPNGTCIHSFDDKPPKDWKSVYKVYYNWGIIRQYKDYNGNIEPNESERMFYMDCDECSEIPNLSGLIKWVVENQEKYDYPTLGQPAGDWTIIPNKGVTCLGNEYEFYKFNVFDNWNNNGYQFILTRKQTDKFCEWLDKLNDYLLRKCGCPI